MLVRQEIRKREIYLAASDEWNGVADAGAAVDVARGDRLAAADSYAGTADGGIENDCFVLRTFSSLIFSFH